MIRSTYIQLIADSQGISTTDTVNERIARHCELQVRALLQVCFVFVFSASFFHSLSLSCHNHPSSYSFTAVIHIPISRHNSQSQTPPSPLKNIIKIYQNENLIQMIW